MRRYELTKKFYTRGNRSDDRYLADVFVLQKTVCVDYKIVHKKGLTKEVSRTVRYDCLTDALGAIKQFYQLNHIPANKVGQGSWTTV